MNQDLGLQSGQTSFGQNSRGGQPGDASGGYKIPAEVAQMYPELVELIKNAASMNDDERQYWFSILPIMNPQQIEKLKTILLDEKNKLATLDEEYARELKSINDKHVVEWQDFQRKKDMQQRRASESADEETEQGAEEQLLKKLDDL